MPKPILPDRCASWCNVRRDTRWNLERASIDAAAQMSAIVREPSFINVRARRWVALRIYIFKTSAPGPASSSTAFAIMHNML